MMKPFLLGLLALMALLVTACGAPAITPQTPPEIVYGEDVCDHCGMIINEERFAAGLVLQTAGGQLEQRRFDDIGDMLAFVQEFDGREVSVQEGESVAHIESYFVHDYQTLEWLDAREAHFIVTEALLTPMGSGIVAFGNEQEAEAQAQAWQTSVLDFEAVQGHLAMNHSHAQH